MPRPLKPGGISRDEIRSALATPATVREIADRLGRPVRKIHDRIQSIMDNRSTWLKRTKISGTWTYWDDDLPCGRKPVPNAEPFTFVCG